MGETYGSFPTKKANYMSIASLGLGVLAIAAMTVVMFLLTSLLRNTLMEGASIFKEESQLVQSMASGMWVSLLLSWLFALTGIMLGVGGISLESRQSTRWGKPMGIGGLVLNVLPVLFCCVAGIIGLV